MDATAASEPFTIERASLFDLCSIWRVERAAFGSDAYDPLTLLGMALNPRMVRLKAVVAGQITGFVAGETSAREGCGWIVTIGVHPNAQGRGIGMALLLAAERELGTSRIRLTVRLSNTRAIGLYQRCGYRCISTYRGYYHDGEDGLVMEKQV